MDKIKANKTIVAIIVSFVVCLFVCIGIPALAGDPPLEISSIEKVLSGQMPPEEAQKAADKVQEDLKKNPRNNANYAALAFLYDYTGDYEKALEALKSEIKYTPERSEWDVVYGNLAREYLNLGRADYIQKPAIKSLRFNPRNIASHLHLLNYYILKGQYREAGLELKILSKLDEEADFYYDIYISCVNKLKDANKVKELFKEVVKANPDSYLAHRVLGTIIRDSSYDDMEENLPLAMSFFNKALELNPRYIPTYISIANTYMYLGLKTNKKPYFQDAMAWVDKAHKIDPKNSKLAHCAGNIFLVMEEYDKGIEKLEYAFERGINDRDAAELLAIAYNNKAYLYYEAGKNIKEGLRIIDRAIALNPNSGLILSTKAELLYKAKKFKEAYQYIQKAAALEPDEPGIKNDLEIMEAAVQIGR
ncbi:MAG: hypothetical protein COW92_05380 [Candidatus Omnitrophica bacterium CG22_combo_CG10-13_8_21_14_all_43_16]|nr:MAG: hypothetical protein COW92_05380 [Candidatus Omnitrophica bacterium CG22_combo_CG10-13_8_21_14_all_43_16]